MLFWCNFEKERNNKQKLYSYEFSKTFEIRENTEKEREKQYI